MHSTPKRQQNTASPDLNHELFDALAITPHQNMPVPPSHPLDVSSDHFHTSGTCPIDITPHHERGSSLEQSTSTHTTGEYSFTDSHQNSNSNLQWGGQEGYDHPSRSANLSRDSSNYSLSSSVSQLSKASLQIAGQMLRTAMDVVVNQSQEQLHSWYHSSSTSTTSIPRPPHSDTSSMYSEVEAGNRDPWAKKQSHSFHGSHSTNTHQVRVRRTPSAPVRKRDLVSRQLANHAANEFTDSQFSAEMGAEGFSESFPAHTPEDYITMKPVNNTSVGCSDSHENSEATPRQSVAVADSRRQSTLSDATIKRVSVTSQSPSEMTIASPRTSVYGKGEFV